MYFRPYLWLTIFSVPSLAVLVMLGLWQLDRLVWKTELIDSFNERANAAAMMPPDAAADLSQFEFHNLALSGRFLHDRELYLTGRTYEGNAGFHVVTPFRTDQGKVIFVNRGWCQKLTVNLIPGCFRLKMNRSACGLFCGCHSKRAILCLRMSLKTDFGLP